LRDTGVVIGGRSGRLLDEVDNISSVSGGSFTAAYYGLHGDRIFDDFEGVFLRSDVEGELVRRLFNPLWWFSTKGRTELAVEYYDKTMFNGATFADMVHDDRPLISINATDLAHGVRFSFVQEYFDLLCSDLSKFPISRAVAASSAVPVLFNPIVVENHPDCVTGNPDWFTAAQKRTAYNVELTLAVDRMKIYSDKESEKYAHMVDGGITDNLGLRAVYEIIEIAGGVMPFLARIDLKPPRRIVVISVNASTIPEYGMSTTNMAPSLMETMSAVTAVQLHRYNAATLELMEQSLARWAEELSTPEHPVVPYFIELGFQDIAQSEKRLFLNRIPTSFSLTNEHADELIEAGRTTLQANPEFRRLLTDLRSESASP